MEKWPLAERCPRASRAETFDGCHLRLCNVKTSKQICPLSRLPIPFISYNTLAFRLPWIQVDPRLYRDEEVSTVNSVSLLFYWLSGNVIFEDILLRLKPTIMIIDGGNPTICRSDYENANCHMGKTHNYFYYSCINKSANYGFSTDMYLSVLLLHTSSLN